MWGRIQGVRLDDGERDIWGNVGMSALVPTGTSAFNEPAAFVTATPSIDFDGNEENMRRTDDVLHAEGRH